MAFSRHLRFGGVLYSAYLGTHLGHLYRNCTRKPAMRIRQQLRWLSTYTSTRETIAKAAFSLSFHIPLLGDLN